MPPGDESPSIRSGGGRRRGAQLRRGLVVRERHRDPRDLHVRVGLLVGGDELRPRGLDARALGIAHERQLDGIRGAAAAAPREPLPAATPVAIATATTTSVAAMAMRARSGLPLPPGPNVAFTLHPFSCANRGRRSLRATSALRPGVRRPAGLIARPVSESKKCRALVSTASVSRLPEEIVRVRRERGREDRRLGARGDAGARRSEASGWLVGRRHGSEDRTRRGRDRET